MKDKFLEDAYDEQTTCEKLGYKLGNKFKVISRECSTAHIGDILILNRDDGTSTPYFTGSTLGLYKNYDKVAVNLSHLEKMDEEIHHPCHYNNGEIECIVAIKASMTSSEFQGYLKGNAMKYLWRMGLKGNPLVDIQKAQWYINKLAEETSKC